MIIDPSGNRWHFLRALWAQLPYYVPSAMVILFGHTLWLSGSTFDSGPGFAAMGRVMSEDAWARVLCGVGTAHLVSTFVGLRGVSLVFLGGVLFLLCLIAYLLYDASVAPSTGVRAYLLYVVLGVWSYTHWDVKWRRT